MDAIPQIEFKNKPSKPGGIEVLDVQSLFDRDAPMDHDPYKHHRPNFFIILMVHEGKVTHTVDFEKYNLQAGDCLVIAKGQTHAFDPNGNYNGLMTIFTEPYFLRYCSTAAIDRISVLYNYFLSTPMYSIPELAREYSPRFVKEYQIADPEVRNHVLGGLLTMFLIKLHASQDVQQRNSTSAFLPYFLRFKHLLEGHYTKTRDAKAYADMIGVTYKHLNAVCKEVLQKTAKSFIDDFVALEIKRQLVSTGRSTKEIGYACGFGEPANFVKFFKRQTGLTPTEFRDLAL